MYFEQLLELWNTEGKGWLKTHRLIGPLFNNKVLQMRFKKSKITPEVAREAIKEVVWFIQNDDFWRTRRRKQGLPWFFQTRGKGNEGEENWVWFYEHRIDRLEDEKEIEEVHKNVFQFEEKKELP